MDSAVSEPPAMPGATTRATRGLFGLVLLAFAAYGVLLAWHVGAYAGGSDSSGYMNHARLLATGHLHVPPREIPGYTYAGTEPWIYTALGFKPTHEGNTLVPTYPVGLPLLIAGTAKVAGWRDAGNVVIWIHAMLGVLLTYATGRAFGLSPRLGVLAAAIVGLSPVYLFIAVQAMSDIPALVWTTAAVLAAWRSRSRGGWAVAAGAAFALAVLIRPTDILVVVPIALLLGRGFRRWAGFIASGVPGAALLILHTHATYGHYFTTGYGGGVEFGVRFIGPSLLNYANWLPVLFTPLIIAGLALPLLARRMPLATAVLGTWILILAGFYATYSCTHETWWYLRFLLPAAPPFVTAALLALRAPVAQRWSAPAKVITVGLAFAFTVGWSWHWTHKLRPLDAGRGEEKYVLAADWLKKNIPADAVIAVMQESGTMFFYTDYAFIRWDELKPDDFARLTDVLSAARRPLYAVLFPFEIEDQHAFERHMPGGRWTQVGNVSELTIWHWSPAPTDTPASAGTL